MGDFQFTTANDTLETLGRRPTLAFATALVATLLATFVVTSLVPTPLVPTPLVLAAGPIAAGPVTGEMPNPRRDPAAITARAAQATWPAETAHARVSTSPDENTATTTPPTPSPLAGGAGDAEHSTPLTRAAARRRVESISPVPWLARFGPVSLERRE